jgi:phage baseplate assembly protein W
MSHIAVPLRRATRPDGTRGLALHEQDSPEEITACIAAVLNTPTGHRIDLPEFGTPRQEHRRGGADLAILERSIALWEPRADVDAMRDTGALTEMARESGLDTVRIGER